MQDEGSNPKDGFGETTAPACIRLYKHGNWHQDRLIILLIGRQWEPQLHWGRSPLPARGVNL